MTFKKKNVIVISYKRWNFKSKNCATQTKNFGI